MIIYVVLYPYTYLLFSISYTGIYLVPKRLKNRLIGLALIPLAIVYTSNIFYPNPNYVFPGLPYWMIPYWTSYFLIANSLLIYSYITTKSFEIKRDRLLTCIIAVPITMADFSNVLYHGITKKTIPNFEFYNVLVFGILFIIVLIKYDILGVSLKLEKSRFNSTMQAMTLGTAFLNHTIKNELQNIWMYMDKIESHNPQPNPVLQDNLHFIRNSTNHILAMVSRIHKQMQPIVLQETYTGCSEIIEQSLTLVAPLLQAKNITIVKEYSDDVTLSCDPVHLREVFINILKNAVEATNPGGKISIQINRTHKWLVLAIKDTGVGISKENLSRVFEPFFSTKNQRINFGLGLSYCYNVMQQHGGVINIYSEENKGTTVFLNFKLKKVLR
jgi:signal transduction histidine kinase